MTFEPQLSLVREADDSFTLYAMTTAPNSSCRSATPTLSAPEGADVPGDAIAITLPIVSRFSTALMVCLPVMHEVRQIRAEPGKSRLKVFVTYEGSVRGRGEISLGAAQARTARPPDAKAVDPEPGEEPVLVRGEVSTGFAHPQGKKDLLELGLLLRGHIRFLKGKATAPYLRIEEKPLRHYEHCKLCGANVTAGHFILHETERHLDITIPAMAVHALVEHGSAHHDSGNSQGVLDVALLARILHTEERHLGHVLQGYLFDAVPLPAGVTLKQEKLRGIESCAYCIERSNLGTFALSREGQVVKLHYLAAHVLAEHGSIHYKGDAHEGSVDIPSLMDILGMRS